jgi:hypothetical protein
MALAAVAAGPAAAGNVPVEADDMPVLFGFSVSPRKLPRTKPQPVRVLVSDRYEARDGSHVPALEELELELDRHLALDVAGIPICDGGGREIRREVLEACDDAVVGKGTIGVELAYPESQLITVSGDLTIYNVGRRPGGADLVGYTFIQPLIRNMIIPIKVRKNAGGRYGWKARFEIPKLAGGAGSVTSYSMHLGKRIFSATCSDGHMLARATSTFFDGSSRTDRAVRTCSVAPVSQRADS